MFDNSLRCSSFFCRIILAIFWDHWMRGICNIPYKITYIKFFQGVYLIWILIESWFIANTILECPRVLWVKNYMFWSPKNGTIFWCFGNVFWISRLKIFETWFQRTKNYFKSIYHLFSLLKEFLSIMNFEFRGLLL